MCQHGQSLLKTDLLTVDEKYLQMPPDKAAAQLSENSEAEEALEIGKTGGNPIKET